MNAADKQDREGPDNEPDNYAELRIKWRVESREGMKRLAIWVASLCGSGTLLYAIAKTILKGLGE